MFPERAKLYMALADAQWITKYEESTYDFWVSLNHIYDLDMSALAEKSIQKYKGNLILIYIITSLQFNLINEFGCLMIQKVMFLIK